jgi:hypothetical protein
MQGLVGDNQTSKLENPRPQTKYYYISNGNHLLVKTTDRILFEDLRCVISDNSVPSIRE